LIDNSRSIKQEMGRNDKKTSTGFRIGISIAMIIMMLGLAIFLNIFTTYAITNQMKILTDFNMPMVQEISHIDTIQQTQYQSLDNIIAYQKMYNIYDNKFLKSQFENGNNQFEYHIKKINELTDRFLDYGLDDDTNRHILAIITNLNEIKSIHSEYVQKTTQIFEFQYKDDVKKLDEINVSIGDSKNEWNKKTDMINDNIQKISDSLKTKADESKKKSVTLQTLIIISAGIVSLALGYFLNLINKDLVQEVIRKTKSLQKANKKLERSNVLKDDFINIASHELKSPLHPIYGFVELAQNGDIGKEEALEGISKQARQLEEVANRILDIGRIDNGILQLSYEKFNFTELLSDIVSSYRSNEKTKIEMSLENGIEVEADRVRIGQVIRNLINNSLKFTDDGTIHITAKHNLEKNSVEVAISDNGSGIHPDVLPNLFHKFATRGPKTESWKGNGLGLYLCRGIISAHRGHIFAYNNKEQGATLKFSIPVMKHLHSREVHQKIIN
jgi:signal transduction histidine kinase